LEFNSAWAGPCCWFTTMCENYKLTGEYFDVEFLLSNYEHLVDNKDYSHWISLVKDNIQIFKMFKSYGSKRPIFDFLKTAFVDIGYGQK